MQSTSLADFWGRRWNITTSHVLRALVYDPIVEGTSACTVYRVPKVRQCVPHIVYDPIVEGTSACTVYTCAEGTTVCTACRVLPHIGRYTRVSHVPCTAYYGPWSPRKVRPRIPYRGRLACCGVRW